MIRRRNKTYGNKSELLPDKDNTPGRDQRDGHYVPKSRVSRKSVAQRYNEVFQNSPLHGIGMDSVLTILRGEVKEEKDYFFLDPPIPSHSSVGPRKTEVIILYILRPYEYLVWSKEEQNLHLYHRADDLGEVGIRKIISIIKESRRIARKNGDLPVVRYHSRLLKLLEEKHSLEQPN